MNKRHVAFPVLTASEYATASAGKGCTGQYLPCSGVLLYYQQVTGDSGSGAKYGDFRVQSVAIGPNIGYTWKTNLAVNAQWFYELDTTRRFQGNVLSFNASWTF